MALSNLGMGFVFTAKDLASGVMRKLNNDFKKLDNATEQASANMNKNLKRVGIGLVAMAAGAKGLQVIGKTTDDAIAFGKQIGEVSTLVDEAAFSTKEMRKITLGMAETFGIDALQQAPALYQAISAGASTVEQATNLMDSANKFAIGGVTDLTSSVNALSSATNTFGLENLSTADAADTMFIAIKAGKTTAEELARSLGKVSPTAKGLGVTFQEMNAAIAATTAQGINTRESVTGLKQAFANVILPTSNAKKEAKRLGIEFDQSALRAKGLSGFIDSITKSAKFNKNSISKLFGSVEALNFITALTSDNSKKFNSVLGLMDQRAGAATEAFNKMNKTVAQQEARQAALKKNISITIGEALLPMKKVILDFITSALGAFKKLSPAVQKGIAIFFALASAALVLGGAILVLTGLVGLFSAVTGIALAPLLLIFAKVALVIAAIVLAFKFFKKAWQENLFGFRDAMRPVIDAVVSLFNTVKRIFGRIVDALRPVGRMLKNVLGPAFKLVGGIIVVAFEAALFVVENVIKAIEAAIKLAEAAADLLLPKIGQGLEIEGSGLTSEEKKLFQSGGFKVTGVAEPTAAGPSFGEAVSENFSIIPQAAGSGGGSTKVESNINLKVDLDGETIARIVKRVVEDDTNRRSQSR